MQDALTASERVIPSVLEPLPEELSTRALIRAYATNVLATFPERAFEEDVVVSGEAAIRVPEETRADRLWLRPLLPAPRLSGRGGLKAIKDYIREERGIDQEMFTNAPALFLPAETVINSAGRLSPTLINRLWNEVCPPGCRGALRIRSGSAEEGLNLLIPHFRGMCQSPN